jgi:hypothetical protein
MDMSTGAPTTLSVGTLQIAGTDGNYAFRLPGTGVNQFGNELNVSDVRKFVAQYDATYPAPPNTPLSQIGAANRDAAGNPYPYIVLPDHFQSGDSLLTHDLRITRTFRVREKIRFSLVGEAFNLLNIANLTGFSGTLQGVLRPTAAGGTATNPTFTFGQATGRVSPVFGSGGPRSIQVAARLSF